MASQQTEEILPIALAIVQKNPRETTQPVVVEENATSDEKKRTRRVEEHTTDTTMENQGKVVQIRQLLWLMKDGLEGKSHMATATIITLTIEKDGLF